MSLTPREAFKVAVLHKCAEAGLNLEETHAAVKEAASKIEKHGLIDKVIQPFLDAGEHAMKRTVDYGIPAAIFGPPVLGYAGGRLLAHATDISDDDVEAQKQRELINRYEQQKEQLRRRQQLAKSLGNV